MPSLLPRFEIDQPSSLEEAAARLRQDDAVAYAGGTELLLAMKYAGLRYERLVDLKTIGGLDGIDETPEGLWIGALATHRAIESSPLVRERFPALAELEAHVANPRVRATGTLGGNLCFGEPHSDPATLLLCLEARVATTQRELPLADFIVGPYGTALEPGEILTAVLVPWLDGRAVYRKVQFHERPMLGIALTGEGRVAIGSASPTPRRSASAEQALRAGNLEQASAVLADDADLIDDYEGSAEYKRHLIGVELRRAWESLSS